LQDALFEGCDEGGALDIEEKFQLPKYLRNKIRWKNGIER
jgi:hypothetical protein